MQTNMPRGIETRQNLTTEEFAALLAMRPQSIRKRYCQTGSYYGVRPSKLLNGKLRWPANSIEILTQGGNK